MYEYVFLYVYVYLYMYPKSKHTNFAINTEINLCILYKHYEVGYKEKSLSCVQLFATPWTKQSMEFSRSEY